MTRPSDATIFALSSGQGRAGVAVLRLSGVVAYSTLKTLAGREVKPRIATLAQLSDTKGNLLDEALVLYFPAPHSYTGEEVVELHLHGSPAVVRAVSVTLLELGLRHAEPGEFTRRAVMNGKLDMLQAEGIADLIDAQTEAQRRQALRQQRGEVGAVYAAWREEVITLRAFMEAYIDFPDEPLPPELLQEIGEKLSALLASLNKALANRQAGEVIRSGFHIAIMGEPNVGKSSLLNYLAGSERAIVSPIPGTTRDVIEVFLELGGYPVYLHDTAGIRESTDVIEQEGIRRAEAVAASATLTLRLVDATKEERVEVGSDELLVLNKIDLLDGAEVVGLLRQYPAAVAISLEKKRNLEQLYERLVKEIEKRAGDTDSMLITRERHAAHLAKAKVALERFQMLVGQEFDVVLAAEELRHAASEIGAVTGAIDLEDVLDKLFSSFCIGK